MRLGRGLEAAAEAAKFSLRPWTIVSSQPSSASASGCARRSARRWREQQPTLPERALPLPMTAGE